jgi:hypothetical protein
MIDDDDTAARARALDGHLQGVFGIYGYDTYKID